MFNCRIKIKQKILNNNSIKSGGSNYTKIF